MSNADEPPRKTNQPPSDFSSLPNEILLEIFPRVPKRYYPVLSCVCKSFAKLLRSPEIHKTRSLHDLDSLYICFTNGSNNNQTRHWFTLRRIENDPNQNQFTSIDSPSPPGLNYSSVDSIGTDIFFFNGTTTLPSSAFVIFDSRSGKFRHGPNLQGERMYKTLGLMGEKFYVASVSEGKAKFQVESFDLKKQIWDLEVSPNLGFRNNRWLFSVNVSLDRKIYALNICSSMSGYDPRDGSCETFELPNDKWWWTGVCVIENVLYVYYSRFGLMWFDTEMRVWRVVDGLSHLDEVRSVGMAEYYGKLAFLWKEPRDVDGETEEIRCRMIGLRRSEVGIHGTAEQSQLLGIVPRSYQWQYCLSVSF